VLAAGDKVTGVSIHWVDEFYDHGQLIGQCVVPVLDGDIPETLEGRVLETLASLLAP
jgi:phosphoribosylglycinamide formyltransferase-1